MITLQPDGTLTDESGKILFFSTERFINDIVMGDSCFICGISPTKATFNAEHVLPDWILKCFNIRKGQITLPNQTGHPYDSYKVPCCEPCNSLMSKLFEAPFSELFKQGHEAVVEYLRANGPWKLFVWLNLIFVKNYYKDQLLPLHRDQRKGTEKIGDAYAWEELHHIHCVARSFYSQCAFDATALGTLFILPAKSADYIEPFDYKDSLPFQTILLRMNDTAILAVLNDSCAAYNVIMESLQRITAPLTPIQLRDLLAQLAYINSRLVHRPKFMTTRDQKSGQLVIGAEIPSQLELAPHSPERLGLIQYEFCKDVIARYEATDDVEAIKQGRWSALFRPDGSFQSDSMEPR